MNIRHPSALSAPRFGEQPVGTMQGMVDPSLMDLSLTNRAFKDSFLSSAQASTGTVSPKPQVDAAAQYLPPIPPVMQLPGFTPLRINFNNDPHEKFKALPHLVSAFRLMSLMGRGAGRDVLNLNAGDNNVGKEADEYALQVRVLNMMNYNAVTMGNHELDLGSADYAKGQQYANFPTVLSNLKIQPGSAMANLIQSGKMQTLPQIIRDQHGTYGLIGVTTPELKTVVSKSAKLEGEEPQNMRDTMANVQAQVDWLKAQGINKIIVLSHMGYDKEQQLAKTVPGIDIIVGGHSHNVVSGITSGQNFLMGPGQEPVLLLQAGKNAQYMGVADVLFDPQGRVIPQQNTLFSPFTLPPDPQAIALRNSVLGIPRQIATMANAFDANGNEAHADPVAQFTADAIRKVSDADIAFVRSSEIRNNFDAGPFTDQDLKALMPFVDPMIRLKLSGQEIMDAMTKSAQGVAKHESHPGMLHPSGLAVTLNRQTGQVQQAYVFNKASNGWEPLNPQKQYSVAMGEFSVKNKEFPSFSHPERVEWNSGQPLRAFFNWGMQQSGAPRHPVSFKDDGRLQIV